MADNTEAGTREQVLDLIVEKGPVASGAIARVLGLTSAAVRRHISALLGAGDIAEYEPTQQGKRHRGRPARHYVATQAGHEKLTEGYCELAGKALTYLGQTEGEQAVESFAAWRSRELERRYAPLVREAGADVRLRAQALADALNQDGYAATVRDVGSGVFAVQLCQGHCPIQQVAEAFPQLCEAETAAFARLLDVHVQRLATLAEGEHVCTTHIPIGPPVIRPRARAAMRKF